MRIRRPFVLAVLLASALAARADETIWTDGTGDWFNPSNWSAGVPVHPGAAKVNNGGAPQITSPGAKTDIVYLGEGSADIGTLSVSGAGRLDATIDVAAFGRGNLNITDGGIVTGGRFTMGDQAGSKGVALVSGAGSRWDNSVVCFVGYYGEATLNITNGGAVSFSQGSIGESNGSTAVVNVDGQGSALSLSGGLTVGGNGTGTLNITNGGTVLGGGTGIGRNPGSNGLAVVSGSGSFLKNNGGVSVGNGFAGTRGTLRIENRGAVSNQSSSVGGNGGVGDVTVDGTGSFWANSGDLTVPPSSFGSSGAGVIKITNGGVVVSANGFIGSSSAPATGTIDVNGSSSRWVASGKIYVGGNATAAGGTGFLRIQNCSTVSGTEITFWGPGTLEIGADPNLHGTVIFRGGTLRAIANTVFPHAVSLSSGAIVDSNGFEATLAGVFSGAGTFTKTGSGSVVLTDFNNYTGATTVNSGSLFVDGALSSSAVTVNFGAVLGGIGTLGGSVIVNGGATLLTGDRTTASGSLTVTNSLTLSSGSTIGLALSASGVHSTLKRTGGNWTFATNQAFSVSNLGAQAGTYDNIITGLAADPGTAGWTITTPGFVGMFTYDGQGNVDLTLSAAPGAPSPTPTPSPQSPCCIPGGQFSDDLEPAPQPGWTFEVARNDAPASAPWGLRTDSSAHSAAHSFYTDASFSLPKDDRLIAPPQDISPTTHLVFWHRFKTRVDYDGGVLEVSPNGGALWIDVGSSSFVSGGYNGAIRPFFSPIAGRAAWTGSSSSATNMERVEVDLGAFAGKSVLVRWRLVIDNAGVADGGWWVDDIQFTNLCVSQLTTPITFGNISTRLRVLTGDNALIGGMIATGAANKRVIIRAIGPTLNDFGVPGALQDPTLELFQGSTLLTSNDDWRQSPQQAEIQNSGLAPNKDAESAIITTLTPNQNYTAVVRGKDGTTGVGVVEAFDLDQGAASKLGNISTRGFVDVDDNVMIAGLIVSPGIGTSTKVLVRALGPTLGDFGVSGFLANPTLDLVNSSGTVIRSNDNWTSDQRSEIEAANLAPSHDNEAALVQTVPPGAYTAVVRGSNRTTGVALVEAYNIQ